MSAANSRSAVLGPVLAALAAGCASAPPGAGLDFDVDAVETTKLITEDAVPNEPGTAEVELQYAYGNFDEEFDAFGDVTDRPRVATQAINLSTTFGLTRDLGTTLTVGWVDTIENEAGELPDGAGSFAAVLRWRFFRSEDGTVSVAWLPGTSSPEAVKGVSAVGVVRDYWSLDNTVVVTWIPRSLGGRFSVNADVGYILPLTNVETQVGDDPEDLLLESNGTLTANLGAGWQWTNTFQPIAEIDYSYDFIDGDAPDSRLSAAVLGAVFTISERTRFDVGVQQALLGRDRERVTALLLNLSMTF